MYLRDGETKKYATPNQLDTPNRMRKGIPSHHTSSRMRNGMPSHSKGKIIESEVRIIEDDVRAFDIRLEIKDDNIPNQAIPRTLQD